MTVIGFHVSHEQLAPDAALDALRAAESAGFAAALCSDHANPWSRAQGHSGAAWPWLGAALATTGLRIGVVTSPGGRYHPAVLAQQAATLGQMFPARFWMAPGTGEYLNESITGEPWPRPEIRGRRLVESVDVIRRLFAGECVTHDGLVTVVDAEVWDRPSEPVPLLAPVVGVSSAERAAQWADGLLTLNQPVEVLRDLLAAYRESGGRGPACLQVHLSWAETEGHAEAIALDQWRNNVVSPPVTWDLATVDHFEALGPRTTADQVRESVRVSADLSRHRDWILEYAELGFDEIYLHHVGQDQSAFVETFGNRVLPDLRDEEVTR